MRDAAGHIGKARELLAEARYLLLGGFVAGAGRCAYLAGFHAALSWIVQRTRREPKTHSGARTEFARLANGDARIDPEFVRFLGRGYELKAWADYGDGTPMTREEVQMTIDQADRMVASLAGLLA